MDVKMSTKLEKLTKKVNKIDQLAQKSQQNILAFIYLRSGMT